MPTIIHERVRQARRGVEPSVVARVASGWIVMGDVQVVRGYCMLLPDPVVPDLNALSGESRETFLRDMAATGDALLAVTGATRINYEILGNLEPVLHAHLFPRCSDESVEIRTRPVWFHNWEGARRFDPDTDRPLMAQLAAELRRFDVAR